MQALGLGQLLKAGFTVGNRRFQVALSLASRRAQFPGRGIIRGRPLHLLATGPGLRRSVLSEIHQGQRMPGARRFGRQARGLEEVCFGLRRAPETAQKPPVVQLELRTTRGDAQQLLKSAFRFGRIPCPFGRHSQKLQRGHMTGQRLQQLLCLARRPGISPLLCELTYALVMFPGR